MSRFKQPDRALAPLPPAQLGKAATTAYAEEQAPAAIIAPAVVARGGAATSRAVPPQEIAGVAKGGMLALCGLILSPYIQDLTLRLGFKPYLSIICLIILPVAFVASGRAFRGLQSGIGKAWLGFIFFATLAIPFSGWPGDSFHVVWSFLYLSLSLFFFMGAFATSFEQCRWIVTTNIIAAVLVLINCVLFGEYNNIGRLELPGSIYLENSNDLALVLLMDMGYFYYLVLRPGKLIRVFGGAGMLTCLYFILKTGSRGGFLALAVFLVVLFFFSLNKIRWAAVGVPVIALSLALMPGSLMHRFTLILWEPELTQGQSESDIAAIASQQERQELMRKALHYTFTFPLTGVGPGQFANRVWGDEHKAGKFSPTLGTHNTYLEVSSECGVPAFFCYVAVILGCIGVNYKGLKRHRQRPDQADAARLAYCLLAISAGFAASIFFHHMAYTIYLPLLSGLTACVNTVVPAPKAGVAPLAV